MPSRSIGCARRSALRQRRHVAASRRTQSAGERPVSRVHEAACEQPRERPGRGSSHSAANPSSRSASYSRRSSSRSASSTASRRLPTRRNASPASSSMRIECALGQRPRSSRPLDAQGLARAVVASARALGARTRRCGRWLRPRSRAPRAASPASPPGKRERARAASDPAADTTTLDRAVDIVPRGTSGGLGKPI